MVQTGRYSYPAAVDPVMQKLKEEIKKSFPTDKSNMQPELRQFWDVRQTVGVAVGLGMVGGRDHMSEAPRGMCVNLPG